MGARAAARQDGAVLFVYGTLMPGHLRWPLVERYVRHVEPAVVKGRLFDTGHDFPAARFDDGGQIEGYLLTFADKHRERAWRTVDRIEGDLYVRVDVVTLAGDRARSYAWAGPTDDLTPIGRRWTGA